MPPLLNGDPDLKQGRYPQIICHRKDGDQWVFAQEGGLDDQRRSV